MNPISNAGSIIPILCFLLFSPGSISSVSWSPIGPGGGGWIPAITVANDAAHTVYTACDVGGIYKSTDHGRTWQIKNNGLTTYYVQDIAYDPVTPSTLYAATRGGVFKSTNGGESWQSRRSGFPDESSGHFSAPISDIVVDPQTPNIVYAGIGVPRAGYELDSFYWQECQVKGSIYTSSDSGEHWTRVYDTGIPTNAMIYSLATDPNHVNILFAATSEGVYKSSDHGATWTPKNTGLPDHHRAMVLVINPVDTATLYVTMWAKPGSATWQGGVFKSTDGGAHWIAKNNGLPQTMGSEEGMTSNYPALVIEAQHPQTLYVGNNSWTPDPGIYKTTDGGEHWTWISRDEPPNQNVEMGWITEHGVFVKALAIDPQDSNRLYFGTSTHVFTTDDGGVSWDQAYTESVGDGYWKGNGMETTCLQDVVVDPTDSETIYAGYWDMGFLKSIDGGLSFKRTFQGMTYTANTFSIVVDPANSAEIYAATGWWEENQGEVCKSIDHGENWTVVSNGLPGTQVWSIAMDTSSPPDSRTLYAASYGNGIYKTTDGGQNWSAVNNGFGVNGNLQVRKIVVDPNNPQILYAGIEAKHIENNNDMSTVQGGLFKSTDGGGSWTRMDTSLPQLSVWDIEVVPGDSQTIYTAVSSEYDHTLQTEFPGGVYKSLDGGNRWHRMDSGFGGDENLDVLSIALSPAGPDILYAATSDSPYHDKSSGRGIFKSINGGTSWTPVNKGLSVLNFSSITVDPSNPSFLYAGSGGNGIFKGVDPAPAQ